MPDKCPMCDYKNLNVLHEIDSEIYKCKIRTYRCANNFCQHVFTKEIRMGENCCDIYRLAVENKTIIVSERAQPCIHGDLKVEDLTKGLLIGSDKIKIDYCPWCGQQLPYSLHKQSFEK